MHDDIVARLRKELPPIFKLSLLTELTGGALNTGTIRNRRSRGEIPPECFVRSGTTALGIRDGCLPGGPPPPAARTKKPPNPPPRPRREPPQQPEPPAVPPLPSIGAFEDEEPNRRPNSKTSLDRPTRWQAHSNQPRPAVSTGIHAGGRHADRREAREVAAAIPCRRTRRVARYRAANVVGENARPAEGRRARVVGRIRPGMGVPGRSVAAPASAAKPSNGGNTMHVVRFPHKSKPRRERAIARAKRARRVPHKKIAYRWGR